MRLATVRISLPVLSRRITTGVVHDHFGFQRLVDHVGVAAWAASAHVHIATTFLPAVARLPGPWLLESATLATCQHTALVWVGHIITLFLAEGFAAVRSDWSAGRTGYHTTLITGIRKRMITRTLVVKCLVL